MPDDTNINALRKVFGQAQVESGRPMPNAVDMEAAKPSPAQPPQMDTDTQRSPISDLVMIPGFRFGGSLKMPPWNRPEEDIFGWLLNSNIEMLEERIINGQNGVFWGWIRGFDGSAALRAVLVRFAGVGREDQVDTYGTEYQLESELDLLSREMASYELIKALGSEDLVTPVCIRDLDTVQLISDAVRDSIAKALRVAPDTVDERLTPTATVHLMPLAMSSFAEKWGDLGVTNAERWSNASDQLRYSIYRSYINDFVIGVADRQFSSFGYNPTTDRIIMLDQSLSLPHTGMTTEKYMQMRLKGWESDVDMVTRLINLSPPTSYNFHAIFEGLDQKYVDEAVATAQQISERATDEMSARMAFCLLEYDVPVEAVASMLMRLAYLAFAPGSVIKRPVEFVRNFCTPIRAGMEITDPRIANGIDYVNQVMTSVLGEPFEALEVLMADVDAEFKV